MGTLKKVLGGLFVAGMLTGCVENSVSNKDIEHTWTKGYDFTETEKADGAMFAAVLQFVEKLPSHEQDTKELSAEFKKIFTENLGKDAKIAQMGFNNLETTKHFERFFRKLELHDSLPDKSGDWNFLNGKIRLAMKRENGDEIARTLLHESGHVLGFGEDGATLFAETLAGDESARGDEDWMYGTNQLRSLLWKAKRDGKEKDFWEALKFNKGLEKIWDEYAPKYNDENGKAHQVMTFADWQELRGYSQGIKKERKKVGENKKLDNYLDRFEELSEGFAECYYSATENDEKAGTSNNIQSLLRDLKKDKMPKNSLYEKQIQAVGKVIDVVENLR